MNGYWQFPVPQYQGAKGAFLDGWAMSGIITLQSGFPIRITAGGQDNELNTSYFFETAGQPNQMQPFKTLSPQSNGTYYFNPNTFSVDPEFHQLPHRPAAARHLRQYTAHRLLRSRHRQLRHDSGEVHKDW